MCFTVMFADQVDEIYADPTYVYTWNFELPPPLHSVYVVFSKVVPLLKFFF